MPAPDDVARAQARRKRVLTLIAREISAKGYPPSVSALATATGVSGRTVRSDLERLERDNLIERDPGVARAIRLKV